MKAATKEALEELLTEAAQHGVYFRGEFKMRMEPDEDESRRIYEKAQEFLAIYEEEEQ